MPEGRWPRRVTTHPRSGAEAESFRLHQRRNSREELPKSEVRGGGWEEQLHVQGAVDAQAQEGLGSYPTLKVRKGSSEDIPLVQGKEQCLRFAGAAVKTYPMPKVRETQVRW